MFPAHGSLRGGPGVFHRSLQISLTPVRWGTSRAVPGTPAPPEARSKSHWPKGHYGLFRETHVSYPAVAKKVGGISKMLTTQAKWSIIRRCLG